MYFFYFDESGSRDPSVGTAEKQRIMSMFLLAVGCTKVNGGLSKPRFPV